MSNRRRPLDVGGSDQDDITALGIQDGRSPRGEIIKTSSIQHQRSDMHQRHDTQYYVTRAGLQHGEDTSRWNRTCSTENLCHPAFCESSRHFRRDLVTVQSDQSRSVSQLVAIRDAYVVTASVAPARAEEGIAAKKTKQRVWAWTGQDLPQVTNKHPDAYLEESTPSPERRHVHLYKLLDKKSPDRCSSSEIDGK